MADIGGLDGLMAKLVRSEAGIAANTVDLRLEKYGKNELEDVRLPTYLELCWEALQDPIMLMLLASAFVQFVLACIPPTRDPCHATQSHGRSRLSFYARSLSSSTSRPRRTTRKGKR